jgi:SM-20-related protein
VPSRPDPAPHDWLRLDPALDPVFLARPFAEHGRLHIPGLFSSGGAERVHQSLEREIRWRRNTEGESGNISLFVDGFDAQPEAWRAQFRQVVETRAVEGFQYLFDTYPVSDELEEGRRLGLACEAVYDLFNAEPFLDFLRRLTGEPAIAYVDAQATRYLPGCFLSHHNDDTDGPQRLYAYVLNFTPGWRPDWGGILAFYDADGHLAEGYTPAFNALNIFQVPTDHAVSLVAPFARAPRLSVTGWVRPERPDQRRKA